MLSDLKFYLSFYNSCNLSKYCFLKILIVFLIIKIEFILQLQSSTI